MRWLAVLSAVWIAVEFFTSGLSGRVELVAGLLPYLLFFGEGHRQDLELGWRRWRRGQS
jgi:hypothetical protein